MTDSGGIVIDAWFLGWVLTIVLTVAAIAAISWFWSRRRKTQVDQDHIPDTWDVDTGGERNDIQSRQDLRDEDVRIGGHRKSAAIATGIGDTPIRGGSVVGRPTMQKWLLQSIDPNVARVAVRFGENQLSEGFVIGRDSDDSDLVVDVDEVSRRHAVFRAVDGVLQLKDLGSSNGTWIEDKKIDANIWNRIIEPAEIRFGNAQFRVEGIA